MCSTMHSDEHCCGTSAMMSNTYSQRPLCATAHPPEGHGVVNVLFSCSPLHTRVGKQSSSSLLVDECGPVDQSETAQRYSCAGCVENTVRLFAPRRTSALHVLLRIEQDDVEDLLDILQHCNCSATGAGMQSKGFMEQMRK